MCLEQTALSKRASKEGGEMNNSLVWLTEPGCEPWTLYC